MTWDCKSATWSDYKQQNTVKFLVSVFPNSAIIYTRRTSGKAIIVQDCFLDVLLKHSNMVADKVLNLFDDMYICPIRRKSAPLLPEGTKKCT